MAVDVTNHMKRILYYIEAIRSIVLQLEGDGSLQMDGF
jgi:hypothetical protein